LKRSVVNADELALRALDAELAAREADLETLRRVRPLLVASIESRHGRCDRHTDESPCPADAIVWTRWCRACAAIVRVCDHHGDGLAAASNAMADHIRETHENPKTSRRAAANGA
jgi:hypothetical protein